MGMWQVWSCVRSRFFVICLYAESATILTQPKPVVLPIGPKIGELRKVELAVQAEGWPLPTFQWYRNGKALPGETSNVLKVDLLCPLSVSTRSYRCTRCKNMCRSAPKNGYEIICFNCGYKFDYKEVGIQSKMGTERPTHVCSLFRSPSTTRIWQTFMHLRKRNKRNWQN